MIIVAVIGNTDSTDCVTDTSEHIRFYKFIFLFFPLFDSVRCTKVTRVIF